MQPATQAPTGPNVLDRRAEVSGYHGAATPAVVRVETFDRVARWRRSVRGLLQCWGAAILSIFIPVAHFFLVPGFLVAGVVLFFRRRTAEIVVRSMQGRCPDCGTDQTFDAPARWASEFTVDCRQCHRRLRVSALAS